MGTTRNAWNVLSGRGVKNRYRLSSILAKLSNPGQLPSVSVNANHLCENSTSSARFIAEPYA